MHPYLYYFVAMMVQSETDRNVCNTMLFALPYDKNAGK